MSDTVDLYGSHYGHLEAHVHRAVREEAYGEDLGQASWITVDECDEFARWLRLRRGRDLLEVACGSGGVAVRCGKVHGAKVVGVDINEAAVAAARARAESEGVTGRVRFQAVDADAPLPLPEGSFDALFCNDAINHLRDREWVLGEWQRVLRPNALCLYTDPIVVTGCLSNEEISVRSSIGFFVFTPVGRNEELLEATGFRVLRRVDVTESVSETSRRWRAARVKHAAALRELEGEAPFEKIQQFLAVVHKLSDERRLSRFAYLAERIA